MSASPSTTSRLAVSRQRRLAAPSPKMACVAGSSRARHSPSTRASSRSIRPNRLERPAFESARTRAQWASAQLREPRRSPAAPSSSRSRRINGYVLSHLLLETGCRHQLACTSRGSGGYRGTRLRPHRSEHAPPISPYMPSRSTLCVLSRGNVFASPPRDFATRGSLSGSRSEHCYGEPMRVRYFGHTDVGMKRSHNEDAFLADPIRPVRRLRRVAAEPARDRQPRAVDFIGVVQAEEATLTSCARRRRTEAVGKLCQLMRGAIQNATYMVHSLGELNRSTA